MNHASPLRSSSSFKQRTNMKPLMLLLLCSANVTAADTVYLPVTEPQALRAGPAATPVRVMVRVAALASRVELHSVEAGRLSYLGVLTDDGREPDRQAADQIFSGLIPLGLAQPGVQTLRVTAYVNDRPVTSADATLETFAAGVPIEALRGDINRTVPDAGAQAACDELAVWAPVGASVSLVSRSVERAGGTLAGLSVFRGYNAWRVRMPCADSSARLREAVRVLAADGWPADLVYAGEMLGVPITDPFHFFTSPQLGVTNFLQQLRAPRIDIAWAITLGSQRLQPLVATIDSGADFNHEDLQNRLIAGRNFGNGPANDVTDVGFHGTAMAGLIAANAFNDLGIAGVAPQSRVLVVRVNKDRYFLMARAADGVRYAAANGAHIINCSLGGPFSDNGMARAIDYANAAGALVVAGSGNTGGNVKYPAGFANTTNLSLGPVLNTQTLAVGGYDRAGKHWNDALGESSYGSALDLDAPAVAVAMLQLGSTYGIGSGTSASTALVSGVAALVLSVRPELTREEIFAHLVSTTFPTGFNHPDGRAIRSVDAFAAVFQAAARNSCPDCPGAQQVTVSGATVQLAAPRRIDATQDPAIHAAYVPLRPAASYNIQVDSSFSTFDTYTSSPLGALNDLFSVSVNPILYHLRGFSDPITPSALNAGIFLGGVAPSTGLQTFTSDVVAGFNGFSSALPSLPSARLSIVLDTFTLPGRTSTLPSWATVTIRDITPVP